MKDSVAQIILDMLKEFDKRHTLTMDLYKYRLENIAAEEQNDENRIH